MLPAMALAHDATEGDPCRAAKKHPGSEDGLRECAILPGEGIRNHGLRGGSVGRLTHTDHGASGKQQQESGSEAAGHRGDAPKKYSGGDDLALTEAVGEKS